jgi:CheY-like chemotaxis protein
MEAKAKIPPLKTLSILLVDDDRDDRDFFAEVLRELPIPSHLITLDGDQLLEYLFNNPLPDIIFIDLNMPRINGFECLKEIKDNKELQSLPVIIYSTANNDNVNDELYRIGADHYLQKTDLVTLKTTLHYILILLEEKNLVHPTRNKFVLNTLLNKID